ncbi:MAG: 6-phosphofructokinase [Thermoleophilia bacterium]|nr:6-phosphofructokinase [Thermoleophilia bacterium]MDH4341425.1 6-phosphofructokinase [Thermoleophilia bacterium]MDH5280666.1 6-phosphofructokinase [Thermoleophilia bacterium]
MSIFGVLTGGGDCPGLNAAIRAVTRRLMADDHDVVGIRNGWRGLVGDSIVPLTRGAVAGILPRGGTILGTSGYNPFREEPGVQALLAKTAALKIDGVVAIGGEGTLIVARRLHDEHAYPVVGVPKTIDNDLAGTDVTIGFDTAVQTCTEAIDRLHTTAESHNRVMVVEVMGRNTGWIATASGIAGGADVILVPEAPTAIEEACDHIRRRHDHGRDFSIVVVAEGYRLTHRSGEQDAPVIQDRDRYGYARLGGIGQAVADAIERLTDFETRVTVLGHTQRGGTPTARDRLLATRLGLKAAELALAGTWGRMAAVHGNEISDVSLEEATASHRPAPSGWIEAGRIVA